VGGSGDILVVEAVDGGSGVVDMYRGDCNDDIDRAVGRTPKEVASCNSDNSSTSSDNCCIDWR
jgi:hypothetical protein